MNSSRPTKILFDDFSEIHAAYIRGKMGSCVTKLYKICDLLFWVLWLLQYFHLQQRTMTLRTTTLTVLQYIAHQSIFPKAQKVYWVIAGCLLKTGFNIDRSVLVGFQWVYFLWHYTSVHTITKYFGSKAFCLFWNLYYLAACGYMYMWMCII